MAVKRSTAKSATRLTAEQALVEYEVVRSKISIVRGVRVMFGRDLAELYSVETKVIMQAVQRNIDRFPSDFMFQLSNEEFMSLKSQFVTSNEGGRGGIRKLPYAFSEQGVTMLSSVLRSPRAVAVNIEIMRAFVHMRNLINSNQELARKVAKMEAEYDEQFAVVFKAIRELMDDKIDSKANRSKPKRKIGFT